MMRRRDFNKTLVRHIGLVVFGGLPFGLAYFMAPSETAKAEQRIPLPGALEDQEEFFKACIGCGLCGEVCPPKCVIFYKRAGATGLNTPYINPEVKSCILCGLCMEVCPTNALTVTPIRKVKMGIAQIDRVACYPWVDRGVCGACVSVCPLGDAAINFEFGNMYRPIVQSGCVGCGQCVEVCPEPSLPIRIVTAGAATVAKHAI